METPKKRFVSEETREKMRIAKLGKPSPLKGRKTGRSWNKGIPMTDEVKERLRIANKGRKQSEEEKIKRALSLKGKTAGEKHYSWKGDKCTYRSLHEWVQNKLGTPNKCEKCGKSEENKRNMHWSNISGEYKRDLSDYKRLCMLCHRRNDKRKSGFKKHFNPDKTRKLVSNSI